ncbi:uncharacterized protein LOC114860689 [Betta splendens]|uniref:Uncharacterized protein LOC114860689 n=1 Tax=Betta splendens TaxID=158456 RepID=A0A9W2XZ81_BETSP|nr:uncharacterized protein LOC114860689 [Betta splendens]
MTLLHHLISAFERHRKSIRVRHLSVCKTNWRTHTSSLLLSFFDFFCPTLDHMELGELGSGCEDETCDLASSFTEDCINQECPVFGMIELVCVTVIYIPLMLFGLVGNILTILVVWLRPQMRSSTYLYLSSMAVSDLLILLLLPLDLYKLWRPSPWPLGDLACKLSMFLSECCTFCTILHITFLSLERYLAVCWPITAKTLVTRRRTRVLIGCLWLGAAISAAPVLVMVGVEEVGGTEGISGWREDKSLIREVEQERVPVGEATRGSAQVALMDAEIEVIKWHVNETKVGDLSNKGEQVGEILDETRQENDKDTSKEKQDVDYRDEGQTNKQNKMKEDEGGGRESHEEVDRRECRCSDYAATSGLLSAMTILSNMYFLIPFCILGLVYSLIGRTLWLRPQSSRKDQSHRNTVKMLGVIVLAFVLCWLPYHVGRTIFSFSFTAYTQEAHTHTNSHPDTNVYPDRTDRDMNGHAMIKTEKLTAHNLIDDCQTCATTKVRHNTVDNLDTHLTDTETTSAHRPYTTRTYATPTAIHMDSTHNDTSHTHPDKKALFYYYLSQYFNLVSSVLFYLSAAVNPLLYNLMSARYRHAVHSLMHKHSLTQSHRLRTTITARHSTTTV